MKDLIKLPRRICAADSLHKINDILTDKIRQWDVFDLDVEESMIDSVKRVIKARDLEWRNMEFPQLDDSETFIYDGVATLVVGAKGADFEKHEEDR